MVDCDRYAFEQAWAAFVDWIRRANVGLEPLREQRHALIDAAAQERLRARFGERGFPLTLNRALDISWMPDNIRPHLEKAIHERLQAELVATFPLRADAGFAWSPEAPPQVRESALATLARHQIRPARLRRELVRGVVDTVLARLGELHVKIAIYADSALRDRRLRLNESERFIETVVGGAEATVADPATELAALRRPERSGARG